ncbi:conserved hypothetical protein [Nitrosococcus halophilus Nc 4]|uniref:Transmembrane protein (PGPGW) n=1 Tax=Nitrosococcus halophilus (strain Nc4) TaxID=472759 RepID=D5C4L8_NITHN|nr:conserved hypothetical protein [Nitrosococcus halophilus Nc 4]
MIKLIYISFGTVSVFTGLIIFWLPIPLGLPLILIGLPILIKHSPRVRNWTERLAGKYPVVEQILKRISPDKK